MTGVIYSAVPLHYNYLKTADDYYSDLLLALDALQVSAHKKRSLDDIKEQTRLYINEQITAENYKTACLNLLAQACINDKKINKSINCIVMRDYFKNMELAISTHIKPDDVLFASFQDLKINLYEMLAAEINSGRKLSQISHSQVIQIAQHTSAFINNIYAEPADTGRIVQAIDQYTKDSIRLGRNWSLGSKIITGVLACIAATAVCCIAGALVSGALGLLLFGDTMYAYVAVIAYGLIGASSGVPLGASLGGIYAVNHFFKPSPIEKKIQVVAKAVQDNMVETSAEIQDLLEQGCVQAY